MNLLFPNFNFSEWITDFYLTSKLLNEASEVIIEKYSPIYREQFLESLEYFEYQIHDESEEYECGTCKFLGVMTDFTEFMAVISRKGCQILDVVTFFLQKKYPANSNHRGIAKSLLMNVKGYKSVDKNGITINFTPTIINNINKFLNRLQIHL
jgi:hypothetical protein